MLASFPGSVSLGIYADRPVTGGSAPSVHRDGRALDWGPASDAQRHAAWDLLSGPIGRLLQVQLVADYRFRRACRPTCDFRPVRWDKPGGWFHVEMTWTGALDSRPIDEIIRSHQEAHMPMTTSVLARHGVSLEPGRRPHYRLVQAASGRWYVVSLNGALLVDAVPTEVYYIPGVALPHPLVAPPTGMELTDDGDTLVVMAGDGGTFAYRCR